MLFSRFVLLALFLSCCQLICAQPPNTNSQVVSNWNGQVRMIPRAIFEPTTLAEVQSIVQSANALNIEVKGTGASHSFGDIFSTNGYLIRTLYLNETSIESASAYTVRAQTGTTIYNLDNFLQANGMVLAVGTVLDDITIGGSVSAGCHGTNKVFGTVADAVLEIRIVNSAGVLVTYSGFEIDIVALNLGLLGIVYDVVLQAQPTSNVKMSAVTVPYNSIISAAALQQTYQTNSSLEIYYFPFAPNVQVRTTSPSTAPVTFNYTLYVESGLNTVAVGLESAPYFEADPAYLYYVGSSGAFQIFSDLTDVRPLRYAIHYGYDIQYGPPFYNPEYAFCFNNNQWNMAANLINATVNLINYYFNTYGQAPCTYGLDIRFGVPSSALLSPANCNTQNVMWVDLLLGVNAAGVQQFSSDVYNLYTSAPYYASPHWPKNWNQIPATQDVKIASFLATRKLFGVDPNNIFVNDALFRQFTNTFSLLI
jgi:hypothetical protein